MLQNAGTGAESHCHIPESYRLPWLILLPQLYFARALKSNRKRWAHADIAAGQAKVDVIPETSFTGTFYQPQQRHAFVTTGLRRMIMMRP